MLESEESQYQSCCSDSDIEVELDRSVMPNHRLSCCVTELLSDCLQQVVKGGHSHSGTAHGASELSVWMRFGGSRPAPAFSLIVFLFFSGCGADCDQFPTSLIQFDSWLWNYGHVGLVPQLIAWFDVVRFLG